MDNTDMEEIERQIAEIVKADLYERFRPDSSSTPSGSTPGPTTRAKTT